MKKILLFIFPFIFLVACKTQTVYVPVESVRVEYISRTERDSVHHYDSVFVREKGDTLWLEKYKYLYRDRFLTDTLCVSDTIRIPYPVTEIKEVNRLTSFQGFQIWLGRIVLLLFGWCIIVELWKKKLF